MTHTRARFFALLLILGLSSNAAIAQNGEAGGYSKQELKNFAHAYDRVIALQKKHKQEMKQAEGLRETKKLQRKADQAMVAAVKKAGLSLDEYSAMVQAVTSDEELAKRVDRYRKD